MLREPELSQNAIEQVLKLDVSFKLRAVAEYYRNLDQPDCTVDLNASRKALALAMRESGNEYFPRILLVLGRSYHTEQNRTEALAHYIEVGKAARRGNDNLSATQASWNVAMLDFDHCNYRDALGQFEGLFPIVKALAHRYPVLYPKYLNNLAALLAQNGRLQESRHAIAIALASPVAARFPEWRETEKEIEEAAQKEPHRRPATATVVAISASKGRPRKAPIRAPQNSPTVFLLVIARRPQATGVTSREHNIVSPLLERYVKTVRIRDSPND
jgi:tetratricopeptide (TPR) repeat protein